MIICSPFCNNTLKQDLKVFGPMCVCKPLLHKVPVDMAIHVFIHSHLDKLGVRPAVFDKKFVAGAPGALDSAWRKAAPVALVARARTPANGASPWDGSPQNKIT